RGCRGVPLLLRLEQQAVLFMGHGAMFPPIRRPQAQGGGRPCRHGTGPPQLRPYHPDGGFYGQTGWPPAHLIFCVRCLISGRSEGLPPATDFQARAIYRTAAKNRGNDEMGDRPQNQSADQPCAPGEGAPGAPSTHQGGAGQRTAHEVIAALEAEAADLKDRLLRAHAEVENIRKRSEREKEETAKYAITRLAREIVNVGDNFQRA